MARVARYLRAEGYTLRTGGAEGADQAFMSGAGTYHCYLSSVATPESMALAATYHPAWHKCDEFARRCHGRNAMIVLGSDLKAPVDFVICWTPDGKAVGGTAMGIHIAQAKKILVFNLALKEERLRIEKKLEKAKF